MKVTFTHISIIIVLILGLIAGNVYQYRNPKVVEIPAGQTAIDSTAQVKRSAYATRGLILDSLQAQNEKLAERVSQSKDEIANYTSVIGRLKLKNDSLQSRPVRIDSIFVGAPLDTSFTFRQTFSDSLFSVNSLVQFNWPYLNNSVSLTQNRDIRLDVVNTINSDRSRVLTYISSPDFAYLQYQTYTQLQRKKELPKFWLGTGAGVLGTLGMFLILR